MLDKFLGEGVTLVIFNQAIMGRLERYCHDSNTQYYRVTDGVNFFLLKESEIDSILIRRSNITIIINENSD